MYNVFHPAHTQIRQQKAVISACAGKQLLLYQIRRTENAFLSFLEPHGLRGHAGHSFIRIISVKYYGR